MDTGQIIYVATRLITGALTAFFAIMLWSRSRDLPWMLMVLGAIAAYGETIYSILERLGVSGNLGLTVGSVPLGALILPNLPTVLFGIAFLIMAIRNSKK